MRRFVAAAASLLSGGPALAQGMANMPGMTMPMAPPKKPASKPAPHAASHAKHPSPAPAHAAGHAAMPDMQMPSGGHDHDMPGMDMPTDSTDHRMPGMTMPPQEPDHDMAGMVMPAAPATGTALPAGNAAPPPPPADYYADRSYSPAAMERARRRMAFEQGGQPFYQVLFNLAEYQARLGGGGYRWDGEAWIGGDIDRLALRTEGEGAVRGRVDAAEIQALWSHAIGPYYTLQGGIRQDVRPSVARTYLSLGAEGLTPYQFETEGRLFLSTHGALLARLEAWYDQRLTQRLILQPRVELNLAAQSTRATGTGKGLTDAELGLRLRYEIARKFAPYVGISYEAQAGRTADYARADGRDPAATSYVAGVRFWF